MTCEASASVLATHKKQQHPSLPAVRRMHNVMPVIVPVGAGGGGQSRLDCAPTMTRTAMCGSREVYVGALLVILEVVKGARLDAGCVEPADPISLRVYRDNSTCC